MVHMEHPTSNTASPAQPRIESRFRLALRYLDYYRWRYVWGFASVRTASGIELALGEESWGDEQRGREGSEEFHGRRVGMNLLKRAKEAGN